MPQTVAPNSHPKTWWIGIIQIQMVSGIWGNRNKARAMLRQQALGRALGQLLAEENQSESIELIRLAVRFNLKHCKADIAGRLHGWFFTNFASTGGRLGKLAGAKTKLPVIATNLMFSTFGATIQSVAEGLETPDHIVNAAISGKV